MEECERAEAEVTEEFQDLQHLQDLQEVETPEAIAQDDEDEVEELSNSLREAVQDPTVKPRLQCLMVDPSFSMVTVQSEDSGIVWETASSRCSTPWASETSSPSEACSLEGAGGSSTGGAQGMITIVFDEEKIVRRRTRSGGSRSRLGDRLRRPGSSRCGSALGVERLEMAEVSVPNVRSGEAEAAASELEALKNKDQQLFSLISEGYEILNIQVPSKLPTVDEEESTEMQDNLSYLDRTPRIRSQGLRPIPPGDQADQEEEDGEGQPKATEEEMTETHPKEMRTRKDGTSDMDYFEPFTMVDVVAPEEQDPESEESKGPGSEAEPQPDETKPGQEVAGRSPSAPEDSFVSFTDVEIPSEHLDEVFYGNEPDKEPEGMEEEVEEDAGRRGRRESIRSLKENGSVLFSSQESVLTPIFLSPGPPKIIDQILLEEPAAMSFHYSDLYEDAVGERRKSEGGASEEEHVMSEKLFERQPFDSEEVDGYLEMFILKDETPVLEGPSEEEEEEEGDGEGPRLWAQSKFEMTGCLTRIVEVEEEVVAEKKEASKAERVLKMTDKEEEPPPEAGPFTALLKEERKEKEESKPVTEATKAEKEEKVEKDKIEQPDLEVAAVTEAESAPADTITDREDCEAGKDATTAQGVAEVMDEASAEVGSVQETESISRDEVVLAQLVPPPKPKVTEAKQEVTVVADVEKPADVSVAQVARDLEPLVELESVSGGQLPGQMEQEVTSLGEQGAEIVTSAVVTDALTDADVTNDEAPAAQTTEAGLVAEPHTTAEVITERTPEAEAKTDAKTIPGPTIELEPDVAPEPAVAPELSVEPVPVVRLGPAVVPEPSVEPEPAVALEPAVESEPAVVPEGPAVVPEPAVLPEPAVDPEPAIEPEPVVGLDTTVVPEPVVVPEPATMTEPVIVPEPVVVSEPEIAPEPVVVPEPVIASEPVVVPEPVIVLEPIVVPKPVIAPEPGVLPEPFIIPDPVVVPEPVIAPEPVVVLEPIIVPKPVIAPEPVTAPEPVVVPEPVIAPEPVVVPEPVIAPEPVLVPEPVIAPDSVIVPEPVKAPEPVVGLEAGILSEIEEAMKDVPELAAEETVAEEEFTSCTTKTMVEVIEPETGVEKVGEVTEVRLEAAEEPASGEVLVSSTAPVVTEPLANTQEQKVEVTEGKIETGERIEEIEEKAEKTLPETPSSHSAAAENQETVKEDSGQAVVKPETPAPVPSLPETEPQVPPLPQAETPAEEKTQEATEDKLSETFRAKVDAVKTLQDPQATGAAIDEEETLDTVQKIEEVRELDAAKPDGIITAETPSDSLALHQETSQARLDEDLELEVVPKEEVRPTAPLEALQRWPTPPTPLEEEQMMDEDSKEDEGVFPPLGSFSSKTDLHMEAMSPETELHQEAVGPEPELHQEAVSPEMELHQEADLLEELDYELISQQEARDQDYSLFASSLEGKREKVQERRDGREDEGGLDLDEEPFEEDYEMFDEEEESQARSAAELQGMDWFCLACGCLLTGEGRESGGHQDHKVISVDQAYEDLREKLNGCMSELQERSENIEDLVSELELAYNTVEEKFRDREGAMQTQNEQMLALVLEQYTIMSTSMEEEKKTKLEQLYDQIVSFQETIDSAKSMLETTAREADTDARSPSDIKERLSSALQSAMSLELGPRGLLVFEDYAKGNSANTHTHRKGIPVPQKPSLQPQEPGSASSTSVTVYWKVNPGDVIDCFQVYCMEDPQGVVSEEYRVTVKESYCVLEELDSDKTYQVWVMAVNYTGCSLPSQRLRFRTAPLVPVIKTESCTVLWDSATLRWSSANQRPTQSFTLEYCRQYALEGEGLRSISGIRTQEQKVLLQPDENYLFYIKGVNEAGASEQSEAALISTRGTRFCLLKNSAQPGVELSEDQNSLVCRQEPLSSGGLLCPSILGELLPARGHYYWETIVTGCSAYRIGVTIEAANRDSPLGGDSTSWCLHCIPTPSSCRFELLHDTVQTDVFLAEVPERVGTLLDYPHRRLSFYNAQTGQLLGTLAHPSAWPCHPALGMEQPGCLGLSMVLEVPEFTQHS